MREHRVRGCGQRGVGPCHVIGFPHRGGGEGAEGSGGTQGPCPHLESKNPLAVLFLAHT